MTNCCRSLFVMIMSEVIEMQREKGISYCGLACALCANQDCLGCQKKGCEHFASCEIHACCTRKQIKGCAYCDEYPCVQKMLKKPRIAVFNDIIKHYGEEILLDCLDRNEKIGICHHYENSIVGDYDQLESMDEIKTLILKEFKNKVS